MRKFVAVVAAAGVVVGLSASTSGARETASPATVTAASDLARAGYVPRPIRWGPCHDETLDAFGAKCGRLVVPRNYARPHGKKISLAVSRVRHTTPDSDYQGVMLVNPGGPGGSGRIYSVLQTFIPNGGGADYDWIGFDPRGVGLSGPSLACNAKFFHGDRPPYRPTTRAIMKRWVHRSKVYARQCANSPGHPLFHHVKTRDSVKDMESLRKALGQSKINLYGFSYGTYLGSVYATLHPNRVRRFVFDGVVNPDRVFYKANQDQDRAFQKSFNKYFVWLARHRMAYHVGATFKQVRSRYLRAIKRLDRRAAWGVLGGDELTDVFTSAGYYVYGWDTIADAWSWYLNTGRPGKLVRMWRDSVDLSPGGDNGYAMYLGTQCTDARWPQSQTRLNRDNWRLDRRYDYFTWANAWFNGPCAYWKYPHGKPVNVTGSRVSSPILMITETFDAATPFPGSLRVRRLFPTASLIEGKNGTTHAGTLSGVACTGNAIARYLNNGTVPHRKSGRRSDKVCPPVPRPEATAGSEQAGLGLRAATLARLRAELQAAQLHR